MDDEAHYQALKDETPGISDFDGYKGEVDYLSGRGWLETDRFEKMPEKRRLHVDRRAVYLSQMHKNPFESSKD